MTPSRHLVAVVVVVTALVTAACNDDSASKKPTSTTAKATTTTTLAAPAPGEKKSEAQRSAIVGYLSGDKRLLTDSEAGCVADAVDLSTAGYAVVAEKDQPLSAFSPDDGQALASAIDGCVDLGSLSQRFGAALTKQANLPISPEEATCISGQLSQQFQGSGQFLVQAGSWSQEEAGTKLFGALGPCVSNESAVAFVAKALSSQGLSESVATCVGTEVVNKLGAGPMLQAFGEGAANGASPELKEALTSAFIGCGGLASAPGGASGGAPGGASSGAPTTAAESPSTTAG